MNNINISSDITAKDLQLNGSVYSTSRLSAILNDIIKHIPRVEGSWDTDTPTQQQLTQYVKAIWAALSGDQLNG